MRFPLGSLVSSIFTKYGQDNLPLGVCVCMGVSCTGLVSHPGFTPKHSWDRLWVNSDPDQNKVVTQEMYKVLMFKGS